MKKALIVLLGGILMFSLFGCSKTKYKLELDGYGMVSKKTEYAEDEMVTVYFDLVATDTNYKFFADSDDVHLSTDFDNKHGFVISFKMPAHDVKLSVDSYNTMVMTNMIIPFSFENKVNTADVWIIEDTEENRKTTLWGAATISKLETGETKNTDVKVSYSDDVKFLLRVIDEDKMYYAADEIVLKANQHLVLKDNGGMSAVLEVYNQDMSLNTEYLVEVHKL